MKYSSFIEKRQLFLESQLEREGNEKLLEFFEKKYSSEEALDESWLGDLARKYLSPKGRKLMKIAKEYYEWLSREYKSTYKPSGKKGEKELEEFLSKELISDDLKGQADLLAGDSKEYQKLAANLLLEYRLKAKKEFVSDVLGKGSDLFKKFLQQEDRQAQETKKAIKEAASKKADKSNPILKKIKEMDEGIHGVVKLVSLCLQTDPNDVDSTVDSLVKDSRNKSDFKNFFKNFFKDFPNPSNRKTFSDVYVQTKTTDPKNSTFNNKKVDEAAKSLEADYALALKIWSKDLKDASVKAESILTSPAFIAELFSLKNFSSKPLDEKTVKKLYEKAFLEALKTTV